MPTISAAAAVSNRTFYLHFANKEEAFLAAFDALADRALQRAEPAFLAKQSWPDAVAAALQATLAFIAADPLFARLAFFELAAAGPAGRDRADQATQRFMAFLGPAALPAEVEPPPEVIIEAIGGGVWTVIQREIAQGRVEFLPGLTAELSAFVLQPFAMPNI